MERLEEYSSRVDGFFNELKKFVTANKNDKKKVFDKFEEFYNWLFRKFSEEEDEECANMLNSRLWKLIGLAVRWSEVSSIILKDFATYWNSKIVSSTMYYCEDYKKNKAKMKGTKEGLYKFGGMINRILREKDFATKIYCFFLLHQRGVVSSFDVSTNKKVDNEYTSTEDYEIVQKQYQYIGDGEHEGEMMTYQQCKELGLKTHLLWDLDNRCYCNEWLKEGKEETVEGVDIDSIWDELADKLF